MIGIALPVGLFLLLPSFLGGFVPANWGVLARNVLEGIVRVILFPGLHVVGVAYEGHSPHL